MPNYQNGKIYSIRSRSRLELVYIGSTTRPLSERFTEHKCNGHLGKQIIDLGDAYIELVEEFKCENKEQLNRREGEIQRSIGCVNQNIAGRTQTEWRKDNPDVCKNYSDNWKRNNPEKYKEIRRKRQDTHKEDIIAYQKQYNKDNKDKIASLKKQYNKDNKDKIATRRKQYKLENKDKIASQNKQYIESKKETRTCLCGSIYNYGISRDRRLHYATQKHQAHIQRIYEKLR